MSTLKVTNITANTLSDANGIEAVPCKAMAVVSSLSTGTTLRSSKNISSIVDNGAGDTTFNFTKALAHENYAVACMHTDTATGGGNTKIHASSATSTPTLMTKAAVRVTTSWDVHTLTLAVFI